MIRRKFIVVLLTILGIYACDNNIADIGQNLIYNETYVEVQRHSLHETYIVRLDSFPTSTLSTLTLGKIKDPVTGTTTATPYFQLYRASWDPNLTSDANYAVFDSLTLNFTYKKTLAGDTTKIQKFSVYRLQDYPLIDIDDPYQYSNQSWPYSPDSCLGTKSIYPQQDFVKRQMPYIKLNTPYGEALGRELFNRMKAQDPIFGGNAGGGAGSSSGDYLPFLRYFKGLVIVPDEGNNLLASISSDSLFLRCHYSIGEKDLYFDMRALTNKGGSTYTFSHIDHSPNESLLINNRPLGFNDTLSFYKNNMGVIQGLSGYMLKVQLPYIKDVNAYKTIIKAEVELETVYVEDSEIPQAQTLGVYVMDTEGHIDYVLSDASGESLIYGYLKQDPTKPGRYSYIIDITDYYISMVESVGEPLHQSLQLLIGLPGTVFKNHIDKSQLINGENSTTFNRAIFEKVPSLNLYYIEYK